MTHLKELKENVFLRKLADRIGHDIQFKDEKILPGTATIMTDPPLPIDIFILGKRHENPILVINAIGNFSGNPRSFAKEKTRGKGFFKALYPDLLDLMVEYGFKLRIYLTPLSPVWATHYFLTEIKETDAPIKGHRFFLDCEKYITTTSLSFQPNEPTHLSIIPGQPGDRFRYLPWGRGD